MKTIAQTDEEKFCPMCQENWPADLEFFFSEPNKPGGLGYCCKACYYDRIRPPESRRKVPLPAPAPRNLLLEQNWMKGTLA